MSQPMPDEKYGKYEDLFLQDAHNNVCKRKLNKYKNFSEKKINTNHTSCNLKNDSPIILQKHITISSNDNIKQKSADLFKELQHIRKKISNNTDCILDDDKNIAIIFTKQTRGDIDTKIEVLQKELKSIENTYIHIQELYNSNVETNKFAHAINVDNDQNKIQNVNELIQTTNQLITSFETRLKQIEENKKEYIDQINKLMEQVSNISTIDNNPENEHTDVIKNYKKVLDEYKHKYNILSN
jgi:DNA repair ATPase RecN